MKSKCCPVCESKLVSAYQRRPPAQIQYVVCCSKYNRKVCSAFDVTGRGETEQDAVNDFHEKAEALILKLMDAACAKT